MEQHLDKYCNLHSTIFILKLGNTTISSYDLKRFTFYNIYIKTLKNIQKRQKVTHLHSTIFILKRRKANKLSVLSVFTFYNIYIKTSNIISP